MVGIPLHGIHVKENECSKTCIPSSVLHPNDFLGM